ncbi:winged helix-turn-helix transcriptional regulator [Streptomyces sp. NPDC090032]|uniref:LexA family protein n=1 Tax=unclassified Streptomyces TaxID=2593676 RepID=UPI003722A361
MLVRHTVLGTRSAGGRCSLIADRSEAPTVREIAAAVGLASPSSALYQLRRLEEAGIVRRARGAGSRDYRLS